MPHTYIHEYILNHTLSLHPSALSLFIPIGLEFVMSSNLYVYCIGPRVCDSATKTIHFSCHMLTSTSISWIPPCLYILLPSLSTLFSGTRHFFFVNGVTFPQGYDTLVYCKRRAFPFLLYTYTSFELTQYEGKYCILNPY